MPKTNEYSLELSLTHPLGHHVLLLQRALGAKSEQLLEHSENTARFAKYLVERTGRFSISGHQAFVSGLTHDIGKLYVKDKVLDKNGPLDDTDWETMKQHPVFSAAHLADTVFSEFANIALSHHEKPDGSGYPFGLKGKALTDDVRLIAFADQLTALIEDRPYRSGITDFGALCKELKRIAEIYFDGDLKSQVVESAITYQSFRFSQP